LCPVSGKDHVSCRLVSLWIFSIASPANGVEHERQEERRSFKPSSAGSIQNFFGFSSVIHIMYWTAVNNVPKKVGSLTLTASSVNFFPTEIG
jgi:hypothetical protein